MSDNDRAGLAAGGPNRLTPADVQQKEFRVSFRGYNERDVDEFLDRVTEELQRYEADLMRLRSERASFDPSGFDVDDESRRILDEARARADAIIREAEVRAAGIPTASGADTRAVVAPYLNREREFLQRLGTLVQDHAQSIKTMVEEARLRTERSAAAPTPARSAQAPKAIPRPAAEAVQRPPETTGESGSSVADESPPASRATTEHDVVVLANNEPVGTAADDGPADGARSLRELFWGED